jgi:hypothetical protein
MYPTFEVLCVLFSAPVQLTITLYYEGVTRKNNACLLQLQILSEYLHFKLTKCKDGRSSQGEAHTIAWLGAALCCINQRGRFWILCVNGCHVRHIGFLGQLKSSLNPSSMGCKVSSIAPWQRHEELAAIFFICAKDT